MFVEKKQDTAMYMSIRQKMEMCIQLQKGGETSAQEGSSTTYLVDEDNPEHAINALGEEEAYIVVVIIAGGMTFCILMVLGFFKPDVLKKRKKH